MTIDLAVGDDVRQLRKAGERPNERLVGHILRSGPAARPHLIELATNVDLLHGDEPECYAPVHALRLLGELPAVEMIDPLLAPVPLELHYDEEKLPQIWGGEMPQMLARIGAPGVEPLLAVVDDGEREPAQRAMALAALSYVPKVAPEQRGALVAALRERLERFDDPTLVAYVLMALGEMHVSDIYPEAMRLFREGKVNQSVLPPGLARQLLLSQRKDRIDCVLHPLWERYEQHPLLLDDEDKEAGY
jgi:hypothetical protein